MKTDSKLVNITPAQHDFDVAEGALELGYGDKKIERITLELDTLRRRGLLIDIDISGIGLFTRNSAFAELGISDDEKTKRYTPGSKFLLPKDRVDALHSVESGMRQLLAKYTLDVTGFRPYRWLPFSAYKAFRAKWVQLATRFEDIKQEILQNYLYYLDLLEQEFSAGAVNTWKTIRAEGYSAIIWNGKPYMTEQEFITAVVGVARSAFPGEGKIENMLQADYKVGLVQTMSDFEHYTYIQKLEKQAAEFAVEQEQILKEEAQLKAEAAFYEKQKQRNEAQKLEIEVAAMIAAELEHAKEALAKTASPFEEVFTALRAQISEDCENILTSLKKNGFLKGKVAEKAAGLVELYNLLAIHDDVQLRERLVELRNQIGTIGTGNGARNFDAIENTLTDIIVLAHESVDSLATRAAFLEI